MGLSPNGVYTIAAGYGKKEHYMAVTVIGSGGQASMFLSANTPGRAFRKQGSLSS